KGLCPISYFVVRRIGRFTGILHQWSSSRIFLVYSRVYAINLLFATVVLGRLPNRGDRAESGVRWPSGPVARFVPPFGAAPPAPANTARRRRRSRRCTGRPIRSGFGPQERSPR